MNKKLITTLACLMLALCGWAQAAPEAYRLYGKDGQPVAYADMDNKDAFEAFVNATGEDDMEMFKERYVGKYESKEDFAYEIVNECFNLDEHGVIGQYFDYKAYAYDLFLEGFTFEDGYVFRDC